MRIVVSGTHASGKSTLISDFALRHPEFTVLHDTFDLVDETSDAASPSLFVSQLRLAAERLASDEFAGDVIAERGPVDFVAYLLALEELDRVTLPPTLLERLIATTAAAMAHVDLLVVLPLGGGITAGADEDLELRDAMNDALLDLVDDPDVVGMRARVVEIAGAPHERLAALEALVPS